MSAELRPASRAHDGSDDPCSPAAFEATYRADPDPWAFRSSPYEVGRYERTVAALPRARYRSAWEPGCSIGELTWRLAARCDALRSTDVSTTAVAEARRRCADLPNVTVAEASVIDDPDLPVDLDLVVLSEVGYYLDVPVLDDVIDRAVDHLVVGGDLVGCHWLGESPDHRLHGRTVHARIDRHPALEHRAHEDHDGPEGHPGRPRHEGYVLDTWRRR